MKKSKKITITSTNEDLLKILHIWRDMEVERALTRIKNYPKIKKLLESGKGTTIEIPKI